MEFTGVQGFLKRIKRLVSSTSTNNINPSLLIPIMASSLASIVQSPQEPIVPKAVPPCPMDDEKFWSHWAAERGYENLISENFAEASRCYQKASQMYGIGASWKGVTRSLVCDAYTRMSEIVGDLPEKSINLRERETFEQSAQRELKKKNLPLAVKLSELTALGWYLDLQGTTGRFKNDPLHREDGMWQDASLKGGYFMEYAASLTTEPAEKKRLLGLARDITATLLDTGYSATSDHRAKHGRPPFIEVALAQATIARLDALLR